MSGEKGSSLSIDPLAFPPPPLYELAAADTTADTAARRENAARAANAVVRHVVTGVGQTVNPNPVMFSTSFDGQPTFTYGVELTAHDPAYAYPNATAGVYRWATDANGFYNGAFLYFDVSAIPSNVVQLQLGEQTARLNLAYDQLQYDQMKGGDYTSALYQQRLGVDDPLLEMRLRAQVAQARARLTQAVKVEASKTLYETALAKLNTAIPQAPAKTVTTFHLSFYGTAIKTLPASITDASIGGDLPVHTVAWGV
jgi:hypothetical protein